MHNVNSPRFQDDSLQSCDQKIRFFDIKYCAQHECPFADNWKSNIFTTWYQFAVKIEDCRIRTFIAFGPFWQKNCSV